MHVILTLVRKDIANFLRNRAAVGLTFFVPIIMIYVFGLVFGLNQKDNGPSGIRLAVVNASPNPAGEKLVQALKAEAAFRIVTTFDNPDQTTRPLTEADLRPLIHDGRFRFAVVIPADVVRTDGIGLHLKILSDPRSSSSATPGTASSTAPSRARSPTPLAGMPPRSRATSRRATWD